MVVNAVVKKKSLNSTHKPKLKELADFEPKQKESQ